MSIKKSKRIYNKITKVGTVSLPVTRVDNGLCLRVALGTGTDSNKKVWHISHTSGQIIIDVPDKMRHYSISFEDILMEIVKKELS